MIVYIVDDSADYLVLLKQVFNRFMPNYPTRFFSSGEALYECIQTENYYPTLVLMDLNMPPGLSGYDTLLLLRQHPGWRRLPVVMMSNTATNRELTLCAEAGATSFLTKPADIGEMKQVVAAICHYWLDLNRLPAEP